MVYDYYHVEVEWQNRNFRNIKPNCFRLSTWNEIFKAFFHWNKSLSEESGINCIIVTTWAVAGPVSVLEKFLITTWRRKKKSYNVMNQVEKVIVLGGQKTKSVNNFSS
jgi:hypothetical protein